MIEETGSGTIRSRVLRAALEAEREARASGDASKGALTELNYEFGTPDTGDDLLVTVAIRPRRQDTLLVNGSIVLTRDDADLVRLEGTLVKRPSFWTRRVDVVRQYARVAGSSGPDVDGLDCRRADCRPVHVLDGLRVRKRERPDCGCDSAPGGLDEAGTR